MYLTPLNVGALLLTVALAWNLDSPWPLYGLGLALTFIGLLVRRKP